jgi:hypothetical protein
MIIIINKLLFQTSNLNHTIFIFLELQLLMIIEKIIQFATIYLIHWNSYCEVPFVILPIIDTSLKQVFNSDIL